MFHNLFHPGDTPNQIQNRINEQHNGVPGTTFHGYAPSGDAVIDVFANDIAGITSQQITANQAAIEQDMVHEIINQGPENVSLHCADPSTVNVVDVANGVGSLFLKEAQRDPRVAKVLNETNNHCYHLEIPQAAP
jgi:hypothetical protein